MPDFFRLGGAEPLIHQHASPTVGEQDIAEIEDEILVVFHYISFLTGPVHLHYCTIE